MARTTLFMKKSSPASRVPTIDSHPVLHHVPTMCSRPSHYRLSLRRCLLNLLGASILAFGLCHIHAHAGVTEGGILGATLLLQHWFGISPAWSSLVMNAACYLFGWRILGRDFIGYSIVAGGGFSAAYALAELSPPLWINAAEMPLAAAIIGALFVGVGIGFCVRAGGAPGGDDALAMAVSHLTGWNIKWPYLISDGIILLLSLSYIPAERIGWSLLTVVLSGQIIGLFQKSTLSASHTSEPAEFQE